jgi:predicted  nucleic acid-binding Zn-ribbon protein
MAKKTTQAKNENGFEKLARLIKSEGDDIRRDMHEQFSEVKMDLQSIRTELLDINRRLDRLEESVEAMKGFSKEIDEMRARMKNIEKHLHIAQS